LQSKEEVLKELEEAKRRLELVKTKVRAEIQVLTAAMDLNADREIEKSFERLEELVGKGKYYGEPSTWSTLLGLIRHINNLQASLQRLESIERT